MKTFVIFDLEATCEDREVAPDWINEIIEIGAVKIDQNGNEVDRFAVFARPHFDTVLTDYCTNLTTITQDDIDNADYLDVVLKDFYDWSKDSLLLSWGGYDIRQLKRDIETQNSVVDWQDMKDRHVDFKKWYADRNKLRRRCGMKKALNIEGIKLEGTHHRGIDDAINTSKIFLNYIDEF